MVKKNLNIFSNSFKKYLKYDNLSECENSILLTLDFKNRTWQFSVENENLAINIYKRILNINVVIN